MTDFRDGTLTSMGWLVLMSRYGLLAGCQMISNGKRCHAFAVLERA